MTDAAGRILLVDDDDAIREALRRILAMDGHACDSAHDVDHALGQLERETYDLALIDMQMPGRSGLDLATEIAVRFPDTGIVMVTGVDDLGTAKEALRAGAQSYVTKPFKPIEILAAVESALLRRGIDMEQKRHRERLEKELRDRTKQLSDSIALAEQADQQLRSSSEETLMRLAAAAEFRDDETARHVQRMSQYCALLAARAGESEERCEFIRRASMLHDVGKIGVPDNILLKAGPLTSEERKLMQEHTQIGYRILTSRDSELLDMAAGIALTHHERVDGTGYPQGLRGEDISFEGRVASICDVFDALTSDRVYRPALPVDEVVTMMKEGRGTQFDPHLLDLFLDGDLSELLDIMSRYGDRPVSEATPPLLRGPQTLFA